MQKPNQCILCDTSDFSIIHRKEHWQYLRCLNCGLVSLYPKPTAQVLRRNYKDYLPVHPKEIEKWQTMIKPVVVKSANVIDSWVKTGTGRLLDIGCGYGFFLQEMKSRGWEVEGIEISKVGRQYAREKWAIPVYSRPLEDLALTESSFDVVTLFYVVEHVLDPITLLREVNRVLKPGGLVLLRWPHSTPIVKILGSLSNRLDIYHTPYHLYDFSPETIEKLLVLSGFEEIETMIGGHTLPAQQFGRWGSIIFGHLGEALYCLSGGNILFPGISKTSLATTKCTVS